MKGYCSWCGEYTDVHIKDYGVDTEYICADCEKEMRDIFEEVTNDIPENSKN